MLTCYHDTDGPEVFQVRHRKAKQRYVCFECGYVIPIGERYEYVFGVWDKIAWVFRTCERCADLRDSLGVGGWCSSFGDLFSDYREFLYGEFGPGAKDNASNLRQKHRDWRV